MKRVVIAVVIMILALPALSQARQKRWFELYDEAIQDIKNQEWAAAETLLLEAKSLGPPAGRNVLRYGQLRGPYFPDYYLGVVYVNTARPALAKKQFELARLQKIDDRSDEFKPMVDLMVRAAAEAGKAEGLAAGGAVAPTGKTETPAGPTPAQQFDEALEKGRTALGQKNYASARNFLSQAVALKLDRTRTDQFDREIQQSQATDIFEAAMQRRDVKAARTALADLQNAQVSSVVVTAFGVRIDALERSIKMVDTDRAVMQAFYAGDYRRVISLAEETGTLSPRGSFYRACAMAAIALGGATIDNKGLNDARRVYRDGVRDPNAIATDRRFISPKVLDALRAGG